MKITKAGSQLMHCVDVDQVLLSIERAGRTCYKSEDRISSETAKQFVKMIIERGHESVLEHQSISVLIVCDRGVSHELVRHRIASFSQESTRYCNYSKDKHSNQLTFIQPNWISDKDIELLSKMNEYTYPQLDSHNSFVWYAACKQAENAYLLLIKEGWKPEQARSVLPNSLKTEIIITANLREWRTIFKQRTSKSAHPQMREIMIPLLKVLKRIPVVFDDILIEEN